MKNFVRLLIVGLVLIGLSGVVSARDITVTYENVTGKITLPEGFKVRYDSYDSSWSAVYYQKEGKDDIEG